MTNYQLPKVTGELIVDVAKTLANSGNELKLKDLSKCFEGQYSDEYVRRAAIMCFQLGFAEYENGSYSASESERTDLKSATKSDLYIIFRKKLQDYAPFLLYVDLMSKEYTSMEAATRLRGIFKISSTPKNIEGTLRSWGKFAKIIEESKTGEVSICVQTEKLLASYVEKLVEALEAEISAKIFTIDMIGPEVFAFLDSNNIQVSEIAKALLNYEVDPKPSAGRSCEVFEAFVNALAQTKNVSVSNARPTLNNWVEGFRSAREISSNLMLACHGLVGIRNMTHHNPDSETNQPWNISKQGALTSTLLVSILIRTMYLYVTHRSQEF